MKVMYLDESGDHSLDKIDSQYPVFVLGGIIVDGSYARSLVDQKLRALKRTFFGNEEVILHTADIIRAKNGFESLSDPAVRSHFYRELNALMRTLDYKVVSCVIKKHEHLAQHGVKAFDPYMLSLHILVERFCYEIGDQSIVLRSFIPDPDMGLRQTHASFTIARSNDGPTQTRKERR